MKITSFKGKNGFLSNFMGCSIVFDGVMYGSVEHAYQAAKTLIPAEREVFTTQITAGIAKRYGKKVTLRPDWDFVKDSLMFEFLTQKYQDVALRRQLMETKGRELVEGNTWHDNYWGSCSCAKCGNVGENRLGKMLMRIREDSENLVHISMSNLLGGASSVGFVGSKACTTEQLKRLSIVAGYCAVKGKLGSSGGCFGADQVAAAKYVQYGVAENFHIHMPWPQYKADHIVPGGCTQDIWSNKFNKSAAIPFMVDTDLKEYAEALASQHVTGSWDNRSDAAKATLGRNALIVMDCEVLVYAINGDSAGTAHDVRIANTLGIPTINVSDDETWSVVLQFLKWEKKEMEKEQQDDDGYYDAEAEKDSQRQRQADCGYPIV